MTTMNADEAVLNFLRSLKEETLLRDLDGKILGRYTPSTHTDDLSEEEVRKLFDIEAIKRRKPTEMGKGLTTQEVLARLHALKESSK